MSFDKIYYINLESRPDRNEHMIQLINKLNLQNITERIDAIDGTKLPQSEISTYITKYGQKRIKDPKKHFGVDLTLGGVGCALSHRKVWDNIVNNNYNTTLILEDDIKIPTDFIYNYNKISQYIPSDYDIVFLGYHPTTDEYLYRDKKHKLLRSKKVFGLYGYVVSLKGAQKLLNLFPIDIQIDSVIGDYIDDLNAFFVEPNNQLINSTPSEYNTEFGTNIQIEPFEAFLNHYFNWTNLLILLIIIILTMIVLSLK
ncbi:glycosyltransferase family 25 [Klosneuvirus KNV1]|uniref:Glycosyltransferase family 25 n=1 Tax=Klosneuvirus KNV1 TaxID=1977640 RepID=A0A1V0SJT4_9VIRU|nr:glycosyltransferase family 25 [Klosneuvirus KNV1]